MSGRAVVRGSARVPGCRPRSARPGAAAACPATGLWRVSGAVLLMVMSSRSVVMAGKRTQPFSSTPAMAAPSGELMCTCSGRVESPPAAARTSSPTRFFPGQRRWSTGESPAIHAVVRSPSMRLRGAERGAGRLVESAVTTIRVPLSGRDARTAGGRALRPGRRGPGPHGVRAAAAGAELAVQPDLADAGERPPGSAAPVQRDHLGRGVGSVGVGRERQQPGDLHAGDGRSRRTRPPTARRFGAATRVIVIFSHFAGPDGRLDRLCGAVRLERAVRRRRCRSPRVRTVGRGPHAVAGQRGQLEGVRHAAVVCAKSIRSHCPAGVPGAPSAHAVSGLPSKAFTGSYCGRWNSQLPLRGGGHRERAAQRGRRLVAGARRRQDLARLCRPDPAGCRTGSARRAVYVYDVLELTSPNRVSARRIPSPTACTAGVPMPGWRSPVRTVGRSAQRGVGGQRQQRLGAAADDGRGGHRLGVHRLPGRAHALGAGRSPRPAGAGTAPATCTGVPAAIRPPVITGPNPVTLRYPDGLQGAFDGLRRARSRSGPGRGRCVRRRRAARPGRVSPRSPGTSPPLSSACSTASIARRVAGGAEGDEVALRPAGSGEDVERLVDGAAPGVEAVRGGGDDERADSARRVRRASRRSSRQ